MLRFYNWQLLFFAIKSFAIKLFSQMELQFPTES